MKRTASQSRDRYIQIYTSSSRLRAPLQLIREIWQDLLDARGLAWQLLVRDIKAQYRQSLLGIVWAFVPAIATGIGLTLANNAKIINIGDTDLPYPAYVMFSMTLWQTFVESLNGPLDAIEKSKPILAKVKFPPEAPILAKLGQVFFNFGIKLILIVILFIWFRIPVGWQVVLTPVALLHLVAFGTFVGILLAPIGALYQDVKRALTFIVGGWLFLTPVIYPPPREGVFGTIVQLNPVTHLLVTLRELSTGVPISHPIGFWIASGVGIIGLLMAWVFYRLAMPFMIERMSA